MTDMTTIEQQTAALSNARVELLQRLQVLKKDVDQIKRQRRRGIMSAVKRMREAHIALTQSIEQNPELFDKPKTRVLNGIRVGFRKRTSSAVYDDEDAVMAKIRSLLPDRELELIRKTEKPVKSKLKRLSAAMREQLGVRLTEPANEVIVDATDDDVDRLLGTILDADELKAVRG